MQLFKFSEIFLRIIYLKKGHLKEDVFFTFFNNALKIFLDAWDQVEKKKIMRHFLLLLVLLKNNCSVYKNVLQK